MTKPRLNPLLHNVISRCPDCQAITSFMPKSLDGKDLGYVSIDQAHEYEGRQYARYLWRFFRCANCNRGGLGVIHDNGGSNRHLDVISDFLPQAIDRAPLPSKVPEDILKEFREAELDAAHGGYRSGSALLRSVLEKALTKNGYKEVEITDAGGKNTKTNKLVHRIEAAADDGVITQARKVRAHENIRVLGNDVLHEDWREVKQEEFDDAHHYCQRVLEDLYDDRATVEQILTAKARPFTAA